MKKTCLYFTLLFSNFAFAQSATETFNDAVLIRSTVDNGNIGFCSGVLINSRQVLTAAHCVEHNSNFIVLTKKDSFRTQRFQAQSNGWVHPLYKPEISLSKYDIGIIELLEEIPAYQNIPYKKICAQSKHLKKDIRVGFGGRNNGNAKQVFEIEENYYYKKTSQLEFLDSFSISGDSGGPVYAFEENQYCLLGIHSSMSMPAPTPEPPRPTMTYSTFIVNVLNDLMKASPSN